MEVAYKMSQWHGGKGSRVRPHDGNKYRDNWDKIFKEKKDDNGRVHKGKEKSSTRKKA